MRHLLLFLLVVSSSVGFSQNLDWVGTFNHILGTDASSDVRAAKTDQDGNIYVVGTSKGKLDFDPGPNLLSISNASTKMFLLKLNSEGEFQWLRQVSCLFGGSPTHTDRFVISESEQAIYITGNFLGTIDFNPGIGSQLETSEGDNDAFVLKMSFDGEFIWAKTFGGVENDYGVLIDTDSERVYIIAQFEDQIDIDPGEGISNMDAYGEDSSSQLILALDHLGEFQWAKQIYNISLSRSYLRANGSGQIFLSGIFESSTFTNSPSSTPITSENGSGFFLNLDASTGEQNWVKRIGTNGGGQISGFEFDSNDNIVLFGVVGAQDYLFDGDSISIDFQLEEDNPFLDDNTFNDFQFFITKVDLDFNPDWIIYPQFDCTQIGIDIADNLYLAGQFSSTVDFDPGPGVENLSVEGSRAYYISKFDPFGNYTWAKSFAPNTLSSQFLNRGTFDIRNRNIILSGKFQKATDFDPGDDEFILSPETEGSRQIFVLDLDQNSCADFTIVSDSISDITCNENGIATSLAFNGNPPYSYSWDLEPPDQDSSAIFVEPGIYTLTVTDDSSCVKTATYIIDGPDFEEEYDHEGEFLAGEFRTGFQSTSFLSAFNSGCQVSSGSLSLVLDDLIEYETSNNPPDQIIGDSLVWTFEDVNFDSQGLSSSLELYTSLEAQIGDTVCIKLYVDPLEGDAEPENNIKEYCYPVVNSYDPNDKQVYPQGQCLERYTLLDQTLTYKIRFQNTGNSQAINVNIIDSLSEYLDINSLNIQSTSHEMHTEVLPGNVLNFVFNDINLPDSASNEELSQGYVIFEISHQEDLESGTIIKNKSEIYFDFNPPIITNTVFNTMVSEIPVCNLEVGNPDSPINEVLLYPNPTRDELNISSQILMKLVEVIDFTGQIISTHTPGDSKLNIDMAGFASGVYLIRMHFENKVVSKRVIKQ